MGACRTAARTVPVALLFEQRRVSVRGSFLELKAGLCGLVSGKGNAVTGASSDRADSIV